MNLTKNLFFFYFAITFPQMNVNTGKNLKVTLLYFTGEIFKSLKIWFLPNYICTFLFFFPRSLKA